MQSGNDVLSQLESEIEECMAEFLTRGFTINQPESVIEVWHDEKLFTQVENVIRIAVQYAASLIPREIKFLDGIGNSWNRSPDHAEQKQRLIRRLEILRPLEFLGEHKLNLGVDGARFSPTDGLVREINKLLAGEESELFQPVYRKSGQRQKAYTEAENKFRALTHEKRLRASGKSPGEAQSLVCNAFGAPWSTIAGWKKQCEKSLGSIFVANELERAKRNLSPEKLEKYINLNLAMDGEAYKRQIEPFKTKVFQEAAKKRQKSRK